MNITIRLDDQFHKEIKKIARETHRTVSIVIENAAREKLYRRKQKMRRALFRLTMGHGAGVP